MRLTYGTIVETEMDDDIPDDDKLVWINVEFDSEGEIKGECGLLRDALEECKIEPISGKKIFVLETEDEVIIAEVEDDLLQAVSGLAT
jgi:hypothetical protein